MENKLKVWFTQGLDIRRIDSKIARRLLEMKHFKMIFFRGTTSRMKKHQKENFAPEVDGFTNNKLHAKVQFHVYIDNDSDEEYNSGVYSAESSKSSVVIHMLC
jgi:hypothetical protein